MTAMLIQRMTLQRTIALVFLLALVGILSALAFQHIGGYLPCALCLKQRYAYYTGIPLAGAAFLLAQAKRRSTAIILLGLCGLVFLAGAGLGIYHSGVEWKWWPGPEECGGGDLGAIGGSLLEALKGARTVSCSDAPWRFLGLSFAGWNAAISGGIALIAFTGVRNARIG